MRWHRSFLPCFLLSAISRRLQKASDPHASSIVVSHCASAGTNHHMVGQQPTKLHVRCRFVLRARSMRSKDRVVRNSSQTHVTAAPNQTGHRRCLSTVSMAPAPEVTYTIDVIEFNVRNQKSVLNGEWNDHARRSIADGGASRMRSNRT